MADDKFGGLDSAGQGGDWFNFKEVEDGDGIVGELLEVEDGVGKFNSRLYTIRDDERDWLVWGFAALDSQFDEAGLEVGDTIGIRKNGTYTSKKFNKECVDVEVLYKRVVSEEPEE